MNKNYFSLFSDNKMCFGKCLLRIVSREPNTYLDREIILKGTPKKFINLPLKFFKKNRKNLTQKLLFQKQNTENRLNQTLGRKGREMVLLS